MTSAPEVIQWGGLPAGVFDVFGAAVGKARFTGIACEAVCREENSMADTKLLITGPSESKEVRLDPKGVSLGRGSNCDIVLDHSNVSRVHAWISQDPFGRWVVEDMESRNGVLLDGKPIGTQAVRPGQKIVIRRRGADGVGHDSDCR